MVLGVQEPQERQKAEVGRMVEGGAGTGSFQGVNTQDSNAQESGWSPAHCESPPSLNQVAFLVSHKTSKFLHIQICAVCLLPHTRAGLLEGKAGSGLGGGRGHRCHFPCPPLQDACPRVRS